MIRRLINRLQGKTHGATCLYCGWTAGRTDLTKEQARARKRLHLENNISCLWAQALRRLREK